MQASDAAIEWSLLQNQFDSYEKYSLLIKLFAIGMAAFYLMANSVSGITVALLAIIWLQDAIWKTFQSRIEPRLLALETWFASDQPLAQGHSKPFQFNSEYLEIRGGHIALVREYLRQAVRPTVAFPHALLVVFCVLQWLC